MKDINYKDGRFTAAFNGCVNRDVEHRSPSRLREMDKTTLLTAEISRGTTHDGPGIRTTVFVKGCPLDCRWCQNPESIDVRQEIWYIAEKCIGCFECVRACKNAALNAGESGIKILRGACARCGDCAAACPAKALTVVGARWSADELVDEVMKDKVYYDEFGGGVTVSGGEPLLYAGFLAEFFAKLRKNNVHTALDTCGHVNLDAAMKAVIQADAILYDIKLIDSNRHKALTGFGNELILSNLRTVAAYIRRVYKEENRKILLWIRTPLIPGATDADANIIGIADFILNNVEDIMERWELCTFNSACTVKYKKMQKVWPYEGCGMMTQSHIDRLKALAASRGVPQSKLISTGLVKQGL